MAATSPGLWKKHSLQNPLWFVVQIRNERYWSNPKMCLSSHQPECFSWEESPSKGSLLKGTALAAIFSSCCPSPTSQGWAASHSPQVPGGVFLLPPLHQTKQQKSTRQAERSEQINFWHVCLKAVANKRCAERKAARLDPDKSNSFGK